MKRPVEDLRDLAERMKGLERLVALEMVAEIEELRHENHSLSCQETLWRGVAEYRLEMMRSLRCRWNKYVARTKNLNIGLGKIRLVGCGLSELDWRGIAEETSYQDLVLAQTPHHTFKGEY